MMKKNPGREALEMAIQGVKHDPNPPKYLVTAIQLPTGAIEIATNAEFIAEKLNYIAFAYDENMRLKTNTAIQIKGFMVV